MSVNDRQGCGRGGVLSDRSPYGRLHETIPGRRREPRRGLAGPTMPPARETAAYPPNCCCATVLQPLVERERSQQQGGATGVSPWERTRSPKAFE